MFLKETFSTVLGYVVSMLINVSKQVLYFTALKFYFSYVASIMVFFLMLGICCRWNKYSSLISVTIVFNYHRTGFKCCVAFFRMQEN